MSNISKRIPVDAEWASHYVVVPTTEYHSSINNRSGIYRHFGSRERCTMATSIFRGTIDKFQADNLHRQRGCTQAYQNPDLSPEVTTHRPQIPLYPGVSQPESVGSQGDTGQRKPGGHYDKANTNERTEEMEEQSMLDMLMKEWINEQ